MHDKRIDKPPGQTSGLPQLMRQAAVSLAVNLLAHAVRAEWPWPWPGW